MGKPNSTACRGSPCSASGVTEASGRGPGIEPERLGRIFRAFHRGEGQEEGAGLGLSIASQAAGLLQAQLSVESEFGAGSTLVLFLPAEITQSGSRLAYSVATPGRLRATREIV